MLNTLMWWYGYVVDNDDPLQMGRVRVRVRGFYDDLRDDALPWAPVFGQGIQYGGVGDFTPLDPKTEVIGYFADGNGKRRPVVMGAMHNIPELDNAKHSVSPLARGEQILDKKPLPDSPEPSSAYAAKYPFNRVITTRAGHAIELDDTEGAERVHIFHKAGTYIEINKDGRIVVKSKDDSFEIVEKDKHIQINGNLNVRVKGNLNSLTEGDVSVTSKGAMTFTSGKAMTLRATNGFKLETDADAVVKAGGGLVLTKGGLTSLGPISTVAGVTVPILDKNGRSIMISKGIASGSMKG